jgi:hypothetical protein
LREKGADEELAAALADALSHRYYKGWGRLERPLIKGLNRLADWLPSLRATADAGGSR